MTAPVPLFALALALLSPMLPGPALAAAPAAPVAPAGAAAPTDTLQLDNAQVRALGLRMLAATPATAADTRYPAQVVLPPARQQVVATPVAALVTQLRLSVGDEVRAGEVVATLRSAATQELRREALTAESQAQLATAALSRDELLHREGLIPLARLEASRAAARQAGLLHDERRRLLADIGASGTGGELVLRAPMTGVVLERPASVGQRLDAAAPLLRLGNLQRLWLELQVPLRDLPTLRLGDAVRLAGAAQPGQTPAGRIVALGHTVDTATQTVLVRAEVEGSGLRIGQAVEVLHARAATGAQQVPGSALFSGSGRQMVFVQVGAGQFRPAPVEVLAQHDGQATVRGLSPAAVVVSAGVAALKSARAAAQP